MVKRFLEFLHRETGGIHEAAYLLGFFAILSQLLALVRDRLFAGIFGAGQTLDIYYAAFRIPDIILISAASVVSVSILIPFLIERLERDGLSARKFLNALFTVFFSGIVLISAVVFVVAPLVLPFIFPGFSDNPEALEKLTLLTRIMLLQPIFLGLSNLFASITQVYKRFFVYAISPLLYNVGIIFGICFFYPFMGISGLAWGVVLGALLHFSIQIPVIFRLGFLPAFTREIDWRAIKTVMAISLPRTVALSAANIAVIFLLSVASTMKEGSIAVFNLSWNLQHVPLAIVGTSYSIASFPVLSRLFAKGAMSEFMENIMGAVRHIIFLSFPALVLFIVLRAQIVRTIFGFGEFDWDATRLTAAALAIFALSIVAQSLLALFIRGFYARGDTKRPLAISLFSASLVVVLAYIFDFLYTKFVLLRYFVESVLRVEDIAGTEVLVLPLAYSVATIVGIAVFWWQFERKVGSLYKTVRNTLFQSFSSSVIMGFATFVFLNVFDDIFDLDTLAGIFLQGLLSGLMGILVWVMVLKLLGSKELVEVFGTLHRKFWKAKVIAPDATEDIAL